jgi:TolB-like protein/class 3 adenylate cyclase/Tfp pilus assembly protein PilF
MPQSHQLAAIMFTDIVGYTALMGTDEEYAFTLLKLNREMQKPLIEKYQGRWIKELGDGVLASFTTVTNAVICAGSILQSCKEIADLELRIGIHLGEVVFENEDIFGDGVNIASRLITLARPGGICISESVHINVANKKGIKTNFLREEILKNVKDPVLIYEVSIEPSAIAEITPGPGQHDKIVTVFETIGKAPGKSVAVLPFVNMSNDPEQEYFSDGVTEEILNSLAHLKDLRVAARTSSFFFKGKNIDLREIGKLLNVKTVLEGSVRKQGNKLRVTAQLINVDDGFHLWSERYDMNMDDIFMIQDEIALSITKRLQISLMEEEKEIILQKPTDNSEAYDLYLKGRFFINKRGPSINKGLQYFKQATEKDPLFALAWSGMADAYAILAFYGVLPPHEAIPMAKQYAEKALQLNSSLAEAYTTQAFITTFYEWNWTEAKKQFINIFNLNPDYAQAHYWYGYFLSIIECNNEEAIKQAKKAVEVLEPLVPIGHHFLAIMYINAGRFDKAIIESYKAIELDPNSFPGYRGLGISLAGLKKYDEAIEALKTSVLFSARHPWALVELCWVYSLNGHENEAREIMDELLFRSGSEYISGLFLCGAAYFVKDYDKAVKFLDKAFEEQDCSLPFINVWPTCSFIRTDPRFQPYLKRMNFPE